MKKNNKTNATMKEAKVERGFIPGLYNRSYVDQLMDDAQKKAFSIINRDITPRLPDSYRIDYLTTEAGTEENFVHGEPVALQDLMQETYIKTEVALKFSISNSISYDQTTKMFTWKATSNYAPEKFKFGLELTDTVSYDEFGFIENPMPMHLANNLGHVYGLDFYGGSPLVAHCYVSYGHFNAKKTWVMKPVQTAEYSMEAIFCMVHWGGSNSDVTGATDDYIAELKGTGRIIDFERRVSKGGKEGCDYYLLPAYAVIDNKRDDANPREFIDTFLVRPLEAVYETQRAKFRAKVEMLRDAKAMDQKWLEANQKADAELMELIKQCEQSEVAKLYFVETPKIVLRKHKEDSKSLSLRMTYDELREKVSAMTERISPNVYLGKKRHEIGAWLDLAPAYASLYPIVKSMNGKMRINGRKAVITLPDLYVPGKTYNIVGLFDKTQFALVKGQLDQHTQCEIENTGLVMEAHRDFDRFMSSHADAAYVLK